ncbi:MAG: universal stress protein [Thermomicrobiales bacterium]
MTARYKRLLVPVNGTPGDNRVLSVVGHLTHQHAVAATLIYVVEVQQSMPLDAELPGEIDKGESVLHRAEEVALRQLDHKLSNVFTELLQARSAGAAIVDEAIERHVDAIVMAGSIRREFGRSTMGDAVSYVLKNAPCEVILVRQSLVDDEREGDEV